MFSNWVCVVVPLQNSLSGPYIPVHNSRHGPVTMKPFFFFFFLVIEHVDHITCKKCQYEVEVIQMLHDVVYNFRVSECVFVCKVVTSFFWRWRAALSRGEMFVPAMCDVSIIGFVFSVFFSFFSFKPCRMTQLKHGIVCNPAGVFFFVCLASPV